MGKDRVSLERNDPVGADDRAKVRGRRRVRLGVAIIMATASIAVAYLQREPRRPQPASSNSAPTPSVATPSEGTLPAVDTPVATAETNGVEYDWLIQVASLRLPGPDNSTGVIHLCQDSLIRNRSGHKQVWRPTIEGRVHPQSVKMKVYRPEEPESEQTVNVIKDNGITVRVQSTNAFELGPGESLRYKLDATIPVGRTGTEEIGPCRQVRQFVRWEVRLDATSREQYRVGVGGISVARSERENEGGPYWEYTVPRTLFQPGTRLILTWVPRTDSDGRATGAAGAG